jgi:hypothetical protein
MHSKDIVDKRVQDGHGLAGDPRIRVPGIRQLVFAGAFEAVETLTHQAPSDDLVVGDGEAYG